MKEQRKRQLRSGTVALGGMSLLAAALTSCSSDPDKRCVDEDSYRYDRGYRVIDSSDCKSGSTGSSRKRKNRASDAEWYYGGKERSGWVDDGSFSSDSGSGSGGSSYDDDNSGVSRGGFGGSGGSSGG
ncbi:hypothetical protein P8605_37395 [Streptomyces sp. T-3]|nr:hypothetical protein [Streptomyces sp. T-3]